MLEAERSFRRIKGHTELAAFTKTLRTKINPETETVIHPDYDKNAA